MTIHIERRWELAQSEFRREYSKGSLPVVLEGCTRHWPARKKWSVDYFADRFADRQLTFGGRQWVMREFIEQLTNTGRVASQPVAGAAVVRQVPYLKEVKLDEHFPELNADIGELELARPNLLTSRWLPRSMRLERGRKALFIGTNGSGFGKLHWDFSYLHVFITQVRGDKDFVIYAPADTPFLYPDPANPNKSLIDDFNDFDRSQYPELEKATPIRMTLREGETLFIPAGWWHATSMRGLSISVAESYLDTVNWRMRADWYLDRFRSGGVSLPRRLLLAVHLKVAGAALRLREIGSFGNATSRSTMASVDIDADAPTA